MSYCNHQQSLLRRKGTKQSSYWPPPQAEPQSGLLVQPIVHPPTINIKIKKEEKLYWQVHYYKCGTLDNL